MQICKLIWGIFIIYYNNKYSLYFMFSDNDYMLIVMQSKDQGAWRL